MIKLFEEWINESFSLQDFKNIEVGSMVMYDGSRFHVKENDGIILTLVLDNEKNPKTITVNFSMFKKTGKVIEIKGLVL